MISGITQSTSTVYSGTLDLAAMRARQQERFAEMDADGNGSIDQAEFSTFSQQMAQKMKDGPSAEEIFAQMDSDGDGAVSEAEFEAFRPTPKEGMTPPPSAEEMFAAMDANADGSIDQSEFETFNASRPAGGPPQDSDQDIFSQMDTDGDGSVSAAEFKAFGEQMEQARPDRLAIDQVQTEDQITASLLDYLEDSGSSSKPSAQSLYQQYLAGLDTASLSMLNVLG